jgi:putative transposase
MLPRREGGCYDGLSVWKLYGSHSMFLQHFHIVWITKYRKPILVGDIAITLRQIIRDICARESIEIIHGSVSKDHVHLFLSVPPKVAISKLLQALKGRTAHQLMMKFPELLKKYWGRHLWVRGYFSCTSGKVTEQMIKSYIENQNSD